MLQATIDCPYRQPAPGVAEDDHAVCGILQELVGVENTGRCMVNSDACRSCCNWFRPSPQHLNPVVASLLYNLSSQILDQGGAPGCGRQDATRLNQLAFTSIPAERDCVPLADETQHQARLTCADLAEIVPPPQRRCGPRVTRWAVGVTTAPRDQATLEDCLASLAAAGWNEPRLFVDGEVSLPATFSKLPLTRRDPQIGAWSSYYLALVELLMRSPRADAYLLVQDDVVFFQHPLLRTYLETILWPGRRPGLVSLFCSRAYTQPRAGWHQLQDALVWGGQAIVFSREAATAFLSDAQVVRHRSSPAGHANIDWLIGEWARREEVPVYVSTPSLAQHIGHVSALWPQARAYGNRRADKFAGAAG